MRYQYISAGSNTEVLDGTGQVFRVLASPADGGTLFVFDSSDLGAAPNYPSLLANPNGNVIVAYPLSATLPTDLDLEGADFTEGLTVAATSSPRISVFYSQ